MLIKKLVECVSKGGNMLLNVGPDAYGNFPPQSVEILAEIGRWMKRTRRVFTAVGSRMFPSPIMDGLQEKGIPTTSICMKIQSARFLL